MDFDESLRYGRMMDAMPNVGIENLTNEQRMLLANYIKTIWESGYNAGYAAAIERSDFLYRTAFKLKAWLKSLVSRKEK